MSDQHHRFLLAAEGGGTGNPTIAGCAILLGISSRQVLDALGDSRDAHDLPAEIRRRGHRRASEARAACDSDHPVDVVWYWAMRQWGDRVAITHDLDARELWLTTDDPEVARWLSGEASG